MRSRSDPARLGASLCRGLKGLGAELVRVRAAPGAQWVALRAATCVLAVLLVLWSIGRLDWAVYATFGAFASVYGGAAPTRVRWRTQARLGVLLSAAVTSGALVGLSPERRWLSIPVAAVWAATAAALSDRHRWRPPGPMFLVFAVAACASVPASLSTVGAAAVLSAASATLAVGLGALEARLATRPPAARAAGPDDALSADPSARRRAVNAVRCAVAVAIAGIVATATGVGHPYWAMVAAVVPAAIPTLVRQISRGLQRALGTAIGLVVAAGILQLHPPALALVVIIAGLQGATELIVGRNYGAALIFITPLGLLLVQLAAPEPVSRLVVDRLIETFIGVGVGLIIVVATRDRGRPPADRSSYRRAADSKSVE